MNEQKTKDNKELKQYKNVLGLTALLLGGQIGAGYASGREVVTFFGDYGWFNIILFFILIFGYAILLINYAKVAQQIKAQNITDVTKAAFGKFSFVANMLLVISMFSGLSATIAGVDSVANNIFSSYNFPLISIAITILVVIIVSGGLEGILKFASIITPLLIITLFGTIFYFLIFGSHELVIMPNIDEGVMGLGIISALFYVGSNLNTSSAIITQLNQKFDFKTLKFSAFLFATFFSLGIIFIIISIYLSGNVNFYSELPMSHIASSLSSAFGVFYNIILFFAMTMTITAVSFSLTHWFKKYVKNNRFYTVSIIIALAFLVSRLGFGVIIDYIYPVKGFGGLIVGLGVFIYYIRQKRKK